MLHDVRNHAALLILPPVRVPLSNGAKREAKVSSRALQFTLCPHEKQSNAKSVLFTAACTTDAVAEHKIATAKMSQPVWRKSQNMKNTRAKVPGMLALILFVVSVIATFV
jgi:hypothetical protein